MSAYDPPPPYGSPNGSPGAPPPNYLVWAILSTLFCCLPLGVVSIVFAAKVNGQWQVGDVAGAAESSRKAKQFALWGTALGAVGSIGYAVLLLSGALGAAGTAP